CDGLWHPVRGRLADVATLLLVALPAGLLLLPQFAGIIHQADIIAGHAFLTGLGRRAALFNAVVGDTRHLNDFPVHYRVMALAAVGAVILLVRRIWWPLAVWLLLVGATVHSAAPYGTIAGNLVGKFSDLFYSDPRRLFAVITLLLAPMAGIALFTVSAGVVAGVRRLLDRRVSWAAPGWDGITAAGRAAGGPRPAAGFLPPPRVPVRPQD